MGTLRLPSLNNLNLRIFNGLSISVFITIDSGRASTPLVNSGKQNLPTGRFEAVKRFDSI